MSIIFNKSKFTKLKYKTKHELAKEISLNSKIDVEVLLETFENEIEEKYFNIVKDLSNRYLLQKIKNNEQSDRELFEPEKGEVIIKVDKQNYIILLDSEKLKKSLSDKLIRYTNESWNTKTISDEISYLPLVYDYILNISKLELHIDESIFFIDVRKLEKVNLKEVKAPEWQQEYVTPPSTHMKRWYEFDENGEMNLVRKLPSMDEYLSNYLKTQKRKDFFNKFKDDFFRGNFYDLRDQSNYAFLLMFFIIHSDIENKEFHLYNLGLCYPKTFSYHLEYSKNHIIKNGIS